MESNGQQLENNGCTDIRHDPQGKTDKLLNAPPANISKRPSNEPFACAKNACRATVSIPGVGNMCPDSVNNEQQKGIKNPFLKLWNL